MISGARELPRYSGYVTTPEIQEILDRFCTVHNCPKSHAVSILLTFWDEHKELDIRVGQPLGITDEIKTYVDERLKTVNIDEFKTLEERLNKVVNSLATVNNTVTTVDQQLESLTSEVACLKKQKMAQKSLLVR